MVAVKNILVPTDFSDFSRHALDYALTFAKTFGAKIIVLHVTAERDLDAIRQVSPYFDPGVLEGFLEQRQLEDRKRLDEFIPSESKKGIEVSHFIVAPASPCGGRCGHGDARDTELRG